MVLSCPCRSPGSTQRRASRGQGDPGSRGASPGISAVILPLRDKQVELSRVRRLAAARRAGLLFILLLPGTCLLFRTEKFAAIPFLAKKRII